MSSVEEIFTDEAAFRDAVRAGEERAADVRRVLIEEIELRHPCEHRHEGGPWVALMGDEEQPRVVSDAVDNQIVRIPDAATRTTSAGTGVSVSKGGLLRRPLALVTAPGGDLLAVNALNGQLVEIDPATGRQIYAQWLDVDQAQSPPGNGDLFGLAVKPDGHGLYYVQDDVNALVEDVP